MRIAFIPRLVPGRHPTITGAWAIPYRVAFAAYSDFCSKGCCILHNIAPPSVYRKAILLKDIPAFHPLSKQNFVRSNAQV
jgi:hypothetical protein